MRDVVSREASDRARLEEEMGDALFSVVNLARKMGIEPEAALRRANDKFQQRFDELERSIANDGRRPQDLTLEQLEERWQSLKRASSRS